MIRSAIVGCGDVASVHAEAIAAIEDAEIVGAVDTDPAGRARAEAHGLPVFASLDEMLEKAKPDVVHVTTPHDQHVPVTLRCMEAGVHVLQEKPLAAHREDGQRLVDAMATATVKVGICFQNRYNASSQALKKLLDAGELGAIRGGYSSVVWARSREYYQAKPWRGSREHAGGGLLINQAIHTLDLDSWFCGPVDGVRGHVSAERYGDLIEVEDTAELLLHHDSGSETLFFGSLNAPRHRQVEIELDCEAGYATIKDGLRVEWAEGREPLVVPERTANSVGRSYWGVSHELLIRDFYAHLDDPEPFWIGPADGMAALQTLKNAYEASRTGSPSR